MHMSILKSMSTLKIAIFSVPISENLKATSIKTALVKAEREKKCYCAYKSVLLTY